MDITVKLFAQYRKDNFKVEIRSYESNVIASDIIADTRINIERFPIGVLMINGRHVGESATLKHSDTLSIFPKIGGG
ncbi:MAG TPA: MoaD/ThiS family protein [Sulfurovum sp.]|nr:MoaD/ThiS family protein [Sulfurovum sp.]